MTPHIEILTDSTCDLPQPLLEQYTITVLPHTLIWGEQQYRDRVDMQPDEFYRRLSAEKTLPTTSQASTPAFVQAIKSAVERGADAVVCVLINSKFSGAIQSAQQAAQLLIEEARKEARSIPVYIHDSYNVTMGLGWQVLAAARARDAGGDVKTILAAAERVRKRVHLYIGLDTLEYVARGGRIGNARRLLGTMLNVKPLIFVDHDSGVVEPIGMAMTRRKMLNQLFEKFFAQLDPSRPMHIAVLHGDAAEDAAALCERVQQEYHPAELLTNITGPILGLNTGPQAIALCGYSE